MTTTCSIRSRARGLMLATIAATTVALGASNAFAAAPVDMVVQGQIDPFHPGQLFTMNADGSDATAVTDGGTEVGAPALSPDGTTIAYTEWSADTGDADLYLIDADGSHRRLLVGLPGADVGAAWSPNGHEIAFAHQDPLTGDSEIYVVSADGSGLRQVTFDPGLGSTTGTGTPAWSPDGTRIAFTGVRDAGQLRFALYTANADGSAITKIAEPVIGSAPAWSPDGTRIAFTYRDDEADGTYLPLATVTPSGGDLHVLVAFARTVWVVEPTWAPDGSAIAFTHYDSAPGGTQSIWAARADGSSPRPLASALYGASHPSWARGSVSFATPDTTAPAIDCGSAPSGWQADNVTIACSAHDDGSGLVDPSDASFQLHTSVGTGGEDTAAQTDAHEVCDVAGNCATAGPIGPVEIDRRPPLLTLTQDPSGANGWFDTRPGSVRADASDDQLASLDCTLDGAAVGAPSAPAPGELAADVTSSDDGTHAVACTARDLAGNEATRTASLMVDTTPPVVAFSGDLGTYPVDATIAIDCAATDATSGVASSTCPSVAGDAYAFAVGTTQLVATATDVAGNTGSASASFTVVVTFAGVEALVERFSSDPTITASFVAKLKTAQRQFARGNTNAADATIASFERQVASQTGKALTTAQASVLTRLAADLT